MAPSKPSSTHRQPKPSCILQYLREDAHCTGTKEGCAEGACGACTAVLAELYDGDLNLKAVNSCIQFMPTLDGKALFTVEDLKQPDGTLHAVQQAMVDCHGSQCGFCTPGFVMSLWALYHQMAGQTEPASRWCLDLSLSGNNSKTDKTEFRTLGGVAFLKLFVQTHFVQRLSSHAQLWLAAPAQ